MLTESEKSRVIKFHDNIKGVVTFENLSPYLKDRLLEFYERKISSRNPVLEIFAPSKSLSSFRRMYGIISGGSWEEEWGNKEQEGPDEDEESASSEEDEKAKESEAKKSAEAIGKKLDLGTLARDLQAKVKAGDENAWNSLYKAVLS